VGFLVLLLSNAREFHNQCNSHSDSSCGDVSTYVPENPCGSFPDLYLGYKP
jgi:hypothetical protein